MKTRGFNAKQFVACLGLLAFLALVVGSNAPIAQAATCTVTNGNSSGSGSLREKVGDASCDVINFASNYTINITEYSHQLRVQRNITINGSGQTLKGPGASCASNCGGFLISVESGNTLTLNNVTIMDAFGGLSGGTTYEGGSIIVDGTLNVSNSTFLNNTTSPHGGAIYNFGTTTVTNSTFTNNKAYDQGWGGAVFNSGLVSKNANMTITNSTFSGNIGNNGSQIATWNTNGGTGFVTLRNTIIANGSGSNNCLVDTSTLNDDSGNVQWPSTDTSCAGTSGDPKLGALANNGGPTRTMALQAGSAALDHAIVNCPTTDQRGFARSLPTCDSGAYEYGVKSNTTTTITAHNPNPSHVGQTVTVNFTVASAVLIPPASTRAARQTGTVTVTSNDGRTCQGTLTENGTNSTGSCNLTFTTPGTKSLTASYPGDTNYNASASAAVTHAVGVAPTTVTIVSDVPDPSNVGQAVTIGFTVQGQSSNLSAAGARAARQTGTVTVNANDGSSCQGTLTEANGVGTGSCAIPFATAGAKSLVATYSGDSAYAGSTSAAVAHTVNAIVAPAAAPTGIPREVPEADTLFLLGGGMSGLGVWLRWQWGKRKKVR